jgi:sRNA-binding protein
MIKSSLKDQLPLEIQEKLAKLREASKPLTDKPSRHREGKKPTRLPPYLRKGLASELPLVDQENQKKAREQFIAAQTWLKETFPKAFNFKDPKPLKVNIEEDISQMESPFSKTLIRKVVAYYVGNPAYLESIVQGDGRVGLHGEKVGTVSRVEKDRALQQLEQRETRRKLKGKWQHQQKNENEGQDKHGIITGTTTQAQSK